MSNMPEPKKGSLWRRKGTVADYRVNSVVDRAQIELMHVRTKTRHWVPISKIAERYDWIPRTGTIVVPALVDEEEIKVLDEADGSQS